MKIFLTAVFTLLFCGTLCARPPEQITIVDGNTSRFAWVVTNSDGTRSLVLGARIGDVPTLKMRRPNYPAQLTPVPEVRDRYKSERSGSTRPTARRDGGPYGMYLPEGPQMIVNPYYKARQ